MWSVCRLCCWPVCGCHRQRYIPPLCLSHSAHTALTDAATEQTACSFPTCHSTVSSHHTITPPYCHRSSLLPTSLCCLRLSALSRHCSARSSLAISIVSLPVSLFPSLSVPSCCRPSAPSSCGWLRLSCCRRSCVAPSARTARTTCCCCSWTRRRRMCRPCRRTPPTSTAL